MAEGWRVIVQPEGELLSYAETEDQAQRIARSFEGSAPTRRAAVQRWNPYAIAWTDPGEPFKPPTPLAREAVVPDDGEWRVALRLGSKEEIERLRDRLEPEDVRGRRRRGHRLVFFTADEVGAHHLASRLRAAAGPSVGVDVRYVPEWQRRVRKVAEWILTAIAFIPSW
jgi:hypothetical protein